MATREMKPAFTNTIRLKTKPKRKTAASVRIVLLILVSFFAGVAATAFWFHRPGNTSPGNPVSRIPDDSAVGLPAPQSPTPPPAANPRPMDPAIIEEVKQRVPNYASLTLDDSENILRAAALKDFAAASKEMDDQVAAAQQRLQDAQNGQSGDQQQAALKNLQGTQAAEAEKLKAVAMRLDAQVTALKSLKSQP